MFKSRLPIEKPLRSLPYLTVTLTLLRIRVNFRLLAGEKTQIPCHACLLAYNLYKEQTFRKKKVDFFSDMGSAIPVFLVF